MKEIRRSIHPRILLGVSFFAGGLLFNEWTVAYILTTPQLGPKSRLIVWLFDIVSLCWGIAILRCRKGGLIEKLTLLVLSTLFALSVLECTIRLYPGVLGRHYVNGVLNKYTYKPGGIYLYDPVAKVKLMIPNFRTEMYYNGYTWLHQTDGHGFRNRETRNQGDILLLGDSFIYGHGLDIQQTVGAFLEQYCRCSVINLARQGDDSYQEAYVLTQYIGQFKPWRIVYFYMQNDIDDLYGYLSDQELTKFIDTPVPEIGFRAADTVANLIEARDQEEYASKHSGSISEQLGRRLRLFGIMGLINWYRNLSRLRRLSSDRIHNINDDESIGWRFTKKAVQYMNYIGKRNNAEFLIAPITPKNPKHFDILRKLAQENNISFVDTSVLKTSDPTLWLPGDGHFTEKGAKTVAGIVWEYLKNEDTRRRTSGS